MAEPQTTEELSAGAYSTAADGAQTAPNDGTSFAGLNRKRGDVDFSLETDFSDRALDIGWLLASRPE
ncbi:MAG: hypothetical protein SH850_08290 [Planctomycetaceae bacterium]|nr:hypothetical protein [Planctomycetaceae bacterium]